MTLSRRRFLEGAVVGAGGTVLLDGALAGARADGATAAGTDQPPASYPFYGAHQSGILTPPPAGKQANASFLSYDLVPGATRSTLMLVLKTLTARARYLTRGGPAQDLGAFDTPSDSDVLGPEVPPDGLSITIGLGASLFEDRFGLAERKPLHLTPMRVFKNDSFVPAWVHGDLSVQVCANHADTVHHAVRDIARHTRSQLQPRWRIEGYAPPPRPDGAGRNLLGFKDGTANPVNDDASSLVWVDDPAEPDWAQGGAYQVVRIIRMLVEFWDRVSIQEQENILGRRRDSGAPLDGTNEADIPKYDADPRGDIIPVDAHIRLSNPRTSDTANQRLLRRSYSYDLGIDPNGNLQAGHIFVAYQQDVARQFEAVQTRLIDEPLVDYVQPFGGGYFFVPPGISGPNDWYASALFS